MPVTLPQTLICSVCVGESYLKAWIEDTGETRECDYCHNVGQVITVSELARHVDTAFDQHFELTQNYPDPFESAMIKEGHLWERLGNKVVYEIMDAAGIVERAADDVRRILEHQHFDFELAKMGEENPFDEEAHYVSREPDDSEYRREWYLLESILKTQARFFSADVTKTLDGVFAELAQAQSDEGNSIIVQAGPRTEISSVHRARIFQSPEELKVALGRPDLHLGPPPAALARAGRMNAYGVSVFYGATDHHIAISEVRPPVGSDVLVGDFDLVREVRLLDIPALGSVDVKGSLFDPTYGHRLERARFLKHLGERLTRPIMPDDEPFEYLVTQVIADYLASRTDLALDGIVYRSVQDGASGMNVMLFHRSSRVESLDLPEGTELYVNVGFDAEGAQGPSYSVLEQTPQANGLSNDKPGFGSSSFSRAIAHSRAMASGQDARVTTLQLNLDSLHVYRINAAQYKCLKRTVRRTRI